MSIYFNTYHNLCEYGKSKKDQYKKYSGLHRHHIIPVHSGGTDDDSNFTYLTTKEHTIAHFMLWKINKNPNDLRSMKMLGGNLTPHRRKVMGEWCRDNKIGFHSDVFTKEQHAEWQMRGTRTQMENQIGFHDPERRREWAVMGGKASLASGNNIAFLYWMSPEGRKKRAQMGSAAAPKKPATNDIITKKFHTDDDRAAFILDNPGWRIGVHKYKSKKSIDGS